MNSLEKKIITGLLVVLICFGITSRFIKINSQVMNLDERVTAARLAGHSWRTDKDFFYDGAIHTVKEIKDYHTISKESKFINTVDSLWREDTQHPPFYYLLSWLSGKIGDGSFYNARLVSAIASCFTIVAGYLLADLIFNLPYSGLITAAMISLSQNQVAIGIHARQFSLYTGLTLLSIYLFLKIVDKTTKLNLILYTLLTTISLYTLPLSLLTIVGKGFYLLYTKQKSILIKFVYSWAVSILLFSPWLYKIIENRKQVRVTTEWLNQSIPLSSYASQLLKVLINSITLADLTNFSVMLGLFAFSLLIAINNNSKFKLIAIIGFVNLLPFLFTDLIKGGIKALQARYIISFQLMLLLAVAYLVIYLIQRYKFVGIGLLSLILSLQLFSSIKYIKSNTWYTDGRAKDNISLVNLIKKENTVLVGVKPQYPNKNLVVSLSYLLPDETKFYFYDYLNKETLAKGNFVYNPLTKDIKTNRLIKLNKQKFAQLYAIPN